MELGNSTRIINISNTPVATDLAYHTAYVQKYSFVKEVSSKLQTISSIRSILEDKRILF